MNCYKQSMLDKEGMNVFFKVDDTDCDDDTKGNVNLACWLILIVCAFAWAVA